MQGRRRTVLAVALSLALHALLLLWAVSLPPSPVFAPPGPQPEAVEFDVVVVPSPDAKPPAQPPPPPKTAQLTPPPRPRQPVPQPPPPPPAEEPKPPELIPPQEAPEEPVAEATPSPPAEPEAVPAPPAAEPPPTGDPENPDPEGAPPAMAESGSSASSGGSDAPRSQGPEADSSGLIPVIPGVDGNSKANPYASLSKGKTIRNGEGEAPDERALAQANGEKARRRVQAFAIDDLAAARVRGGVVDGYFNDMRRVLQKSAENPPKFTEGATFVHDLVDAWKPGASQYAATGNPYASGKTGNGSAERDMQDPVTQNSGRPGSAEAEVFARRQATDRLREFADGRFGEGIIAVVEIKQSRSGAFETAALVRSSGNRLFDKFVMDTVPEAVLKVPAAPAQGQGIHSDGIRTLWSFEGRVVFKRKVKPGELSAKDWAGLAAMQALSAVTNNWVPGGLGNFDEMTGELEVIDLTQPRFTCTPKLMRIY